MARFRQHGCPPYAVVFLHGGPGAAGDVAPIARELSESCGVLEPVQTAKSVMGQVEELREVVKEKIHVPTCLIGYSWGAWLAYIFAAKYPDCVRKLILVSAGPFDASYKPQMQQRRLDRLKGEDGILAKELLSLVAQGRKLTQEQFAALGRLMSAADHFDVDPNSKQNHQVGIDHEIYNAVWPEADQLRESGELLALAASIHCPVVVIHGEQDPHPWQGVVEPLRARLRDLQVHVLPACGHTPWLERQAREHFLKILRCAIL